MALVLRFFADEKGVTTVEYCLIAMGVGVGLLGAIGFAAPAIFSVFKMVAETGPVD
ncbi:Flp family type IVb pilin [Phenylobacterium sp.]|uniref:Flp family type IVb pilin n=1 Tax=Phenylobacterium sp. TaxID=1871053 RepID=UPI0027306AA8|nr:hypothetical protein [Phenylobacterium sp.]MDP1600635.1 hypothetical protein [Phenylobacterium sp.]MDP3593441.1 hypothetical protein [Phenylobacterium sp.]